MTAAGRRLAAEFTGTALLTAVVIGSGIAATRLTSDAALRLLVNSVATALGLAVLILVFAPASGAYAGTAPASAPAFVAAQVAGGTLGTMLAVIIYPARPAASPGAQFPLPAADLEGAPA